jgi:2-hydroxy-3-keto-5-methylthiopentenyl-1-phosphate phosphatase
MSTTSQNPRRQPAGGQSSRPVAPAALSAPVPPLQPGQPPLAILVDYDGTIAKTDVADQILLKFIGEQYSRDDAAYSAGIVGSRTLYTSQVKLLPGSAAEVSVLADAQPLDLTFAPFVSRALELGVAVEVVSDGFGFYIEPALERLGVPTIPVITARTKFDGRRASMEFPFGHPDCLVCGTCKRQRVIAHQAAGRSVAMVGDGYSDRYAASLADVTFAKGTLVDLCRAEGWECIPWADFAVVAAWLDDAVGAWRMDPQSLPHHRNRPFICGPEAWGPGRTDPPHD